MLHFSCDLCGQDLDDHRYVVKMELFPAFDPSAITEDDLDADNLEDVADLLNEMEITGDTELEDASSKAFRFDMCPACHAKFSQDPLGRDALRRLNFSKN